MLVFKYCIPPNIACILLCPTTYPIRNPNLRVDLSKATAPSQLPLAPAAINRKSNASFESLTRVLLFTRFLRYPRRPTQQEDNEK